MSNEDWGMSLAKAVAGKSKDPSTKVGCVLMDPENNAVISTGYNGFPRGASLDHNEKAWAKDVKYKIVIHAEMNAIGNAARLGVKTLGTTLYSTKFPCAACAKIIVAAGIVNVISPPADYFCETWGIEFVQASTILDVAGVKCFPNNSLEV